MARAKKASLLLSAATVLAIALVDCGSSATATSSRAAPAATIAPEQKVQGTTLILSSPAFAAGESIPTQYSCDGDDISPPLEWNDPPAGTQAFALIVTDPDAPGGTWVHWVLFNLPAGTRAMPESVPNNEELDDGGRHGRDSWKRLGYGGPCPPGGTHRYLFKLYALDSTLALDPGANEKSLLAAMKGHILAESELTGTYAR